MKHCFNQNLHPSRLVLAVIFVLVLMLMLVYQALQQAHDSARRANGLWVGQTVSRAIAFDLIAGNQQGIRAQIATIGLPDFIIGYQVILANGDLMINEMPSPIMGNELMVQVPIAFTQRVTEELDQLFGEEFLFYQHQQQLQRQQQVGQSRGASTSLGDLVLYLKAPNVIYKESKLFLIIAAAVIGFFTLLLIYLSIISKKVLNPALHLTQKIAQLGGEKPNTPPQLPEGLEAALQTTYDRLASNIESLNQRNQDKSYYFASTGHEIRNPLNSVILYNQAALNELSPAEPGYENVSKAVHSAELLLKIVNDLIDIEKLEIDKFVLEEEVFNLEGIIVSCVEFVTPLLGDDIQLITPQFQGVNRLYKGDPTRVKQIIMNLLHNAAKATFHGFIEISLDVESLNSGSMANLIFKIRDSGSGIPEDQQSNIFQPFDRVRARAPGEGSGLGLYIVQRLIEAMQGSIAVKSAPALGTEFTFNIELNNVNSADLEETTAMKFNGNAGVHLKGLKVLIVDDSRANSEPLAKNFRALGCVATTCNSGREALAAINDTLDWVVMDLCMPGMDGFDTLLEIRRKGYQMPVIAMSGLPNKTVEAKCARLKFNDFVPKPINFQRLIEKSVLVLGLGEGLAVPQLEQCDASRLLLDLPSINLSYHFGADVTIETLRTSLGYFEQEWQEVELQLMRFVDACNFKALGSLCHKLAGDSIKLGAHRLVSMATLIAEDEEVQSLLGVLAPKLARELANVLESVHRQLQHLQTLESQFT